MILKKSINNPHKTAVIHNNKSYSYGGLWTDVKKLAWWFNDNLELIDSFGVVIESADLRIANKFDIIEKDLAEIKILLEKIF